MSILENDSSTYFLFRSRPITCDLLIYVYILKLLNIQHRQSNLFIYMH